MRLALFGKPQHNRHQAWHNEKNNSLLYFAQPKVDLLETYVCPFSLLLIILINVLEANSFAVTWQVSPEMAIIEIFFCLIILVTTHELRAT